MPGPAPTVATATNRIDLERLGIITMLVSDSKSTTTNAVLSGERGKLPSENGASHCSVCGLAQLFCCDVATAAINRVMRSERWLPAQDARLSRARPWVPVAVHAARSVDGAIAARDWKNAASFSM